MIQTSKLGCMVRKVIDSILPHAEFGRNDHRKDAPPFIRGYTLDSNAGPPITRTDSLISVFRMCPAASGRGLCDIDRV